RVEGPGPGGSANGPGDRPDLGSEPRGEVVSPVADVGPAPAVPAPAFGDQWADAEPVGGAEP
ncbi:MAG TPA: hypothetical protein VII19_12320, partial [Acidimicrobiales bacterium]